MEFKSYPKIPRLNRACVITEKIDGTNAQVLIHNFDTFKKDYSNYVFGEPLYPEEMPVLDDLARQEWGKEQDKNGTINLNQWSKDWIIRAGSRNRWLTSEQDNFGFHKWVTENASELLKLGPGRHYGEWWGQGIQRGYGLDHKRFSLFRHSDFSDLPSCVFRVPVLVDNLSEFRVAVSTALHILKTEGSKAAPGFMNPEGIVVWHTHGGVQFKVTLENDSVGKTD